MIRLRSFDQHSTAIWLPCDELP